MTFAELGVLPALVTGLEKAAITVPTPIQVEALPLLLAGKNAYLNSETGTGKTLAYLLPLFCRLDPLQETPQFVVLAPTHELAIQIQREVSSLAQNSGLPVRSVLLIGGTVLSRQLEKLKKKPHFIIGSPGRVRDLIGMHKLKVQAVKSIVIDEADRLLGDETLAVVRAIIRTMPRERQTIFASATEHASCSREAVALAPGLVVLRAGTGGVNRRIQHLYLVCEERDKPELLRKLVRALNPERAMVFVHRNARAEEVAGKLAFHKMAVADLHGAFDKSERKKAMDDFRSARVSVMIASDLAARGLDIKGVTHIFNLDMPTESKDYLHRVGRTARADAEGYAISLMTEQELRLVKRYEADLSIRMIRGQLRDGKLEPADPA